MQRDATNVEASDRSGAGRDETEEERGLAFLALAMTGAIGLVTDVVFDATVAVVSAALIGLAFVTLWLAWPVRRRAERERDAA